MLYLKVHYIENLNVCYIEGWLLTFVVVGFFFFLWCDIVLFSILLLFCIIMGLCPASSAVKVLAHTFYCNFGQAEEYCLFYRGLCYIEVQ